MPTAKKQQRTEVKKRKVIYAKPETQLCLVSNSKEITAAYAKQLLGWEEENKETVFGSKFLLKVKGKKIRCTNNITNRPIYMGILSALKQEHLRKRWRFNAEPIIIGRTGLILNGQHTLLSIILAAQDWKEDKGAYPAWKKVPTMEKSITFGIDEDDETVNTMDTCKPRNLSDVIYRAHYFKNLPSREQRRVAKITDHCIRMLWVRTGACRNAFTMQRTHSESIAFLSNHPRILKAVQFIYESDDGAISKYLSSGYAAASLYLMASCDTKPETYFLSDIPKEESIVFNQWDKACDFFRDLESNSPKLKEFRLTIDKLYENDHTRWIERWNSIIKCWEFYIEDQTKIMVVDDLYPEFAFRNDTECLAEHRLFGGIDVGEDGPAFAIKGDPTKKDIKTRKKSKSKVHPEELVANRVSKDWAKGDKAWVHNPTAPGDEPYFTTLSDEPFSCADGEVRVMVTSDEGDWEEKVKYLSLSRFEISI